MVRELIDGSEYECEDFEIKSAYTIPDGWYIGDSKWAYRLCKVRGIKPEPREPSCFSSNAGRGRTCSIGFCEKEQKFYGWSHRAIYGFGIGSKVKKGDCAYSPTDKDDFLEDCIRFWGGDNHDEIKGIFVADGVDISWIYDERTYNKKLRGKKGGTFCHYPSQWGRGEWVAETLNDARQMAIDFAEGVD